MGATGPLACLASSRFFLLPFMRTLLLSPSSRAFSIPVLRWYASTLSVGYLIGMLSRRFRWSHGWIDPASSPDGWAGGRVGGNKHPAEVGKHGEERPGPYQARKQNPTPYKESGSPMSRVLGLAMSEGCGLPNAFASSLRDLSFLLSWFALGWWTLAVLCGFAHLEH
jgi:hypothetical protein